MKILMAMSGGIDSTISALLLQEQGHQLIGATFRTFDEDATDCAKKGCGSEDSVVEAQALAAQLHLEHHILDFRQVFRETVICNFVQEYLQGRTPNPCVVCNSSIKWGMLLQKADELGCEGIATGHYARIGEENGRMFLRLAADTHKDQTYFLWKLTEAELRRTYFPLGDFTKAKVRAMAQAHGFETLVQKSESQDICFLPNGNYRQFLAENVPDFPALCRQGDFLDTTGQVIGQHEGFPNYTIGQRKGLKVAFGTPRYVTAINAAHNTVTLGERHELYSSDLRAEECNFSLPDNWQNGSKVQARIRYRSAAAEATMWVQGDSATLHFTEPVWGITPGQSVVMYQADRVIGGGIIIGSD